MFTFTTNTTNTNTSTTNNNTATNTGRTAPARIAVKLGVIGLAAGAALGLSAGSVSALDEIAIIEQTCPKSGKVDVVGNATTVTVNAPAGKLIAGYCVKAGSSKHGDGPEHVVVDPPAAQVTFGHSSGKAVSHYTIVVVDKPGDLTLPDPDPDPEHPGDLKLPDPTDPVDDPEPTEDPEPQVEQLPPANPSDPADPTAPADPSDPAGPAAGQLPQTGTGTTLLAALAALLVGLGGTALRVARRLPT